MAKAHVYAHLVAKPVVKWREVPEDVVLTLTPQEAITLYALTGKIAGDMECTPRKHTSAIADALRSAGVPRLILGKGQINYDDRDVADIGAAVDGWEVKTNA